MSQPIARTVTRSIRKSAEARKVAADAYPFKCCAVCGLQLQTCLNIAHLDQNAGNNDPDNLAYLCPTHHWMYDAGLYPVDAIKLMRNHWHDNADRVNHSLRMKDAGVKAALTRKRTRTAKKAWATRRRPG